MKPKLIVEQKITPFANMYRVYSVNKEGVRDQLIAFAQQKRLAFKEKVTFYGDEEKTEALFTMRAEKVVDVHGRYLIEDMNGTLLGAFRKDFKASFFKSTWLLLGDDDAPVVRIEESNAALAIARRYIGFIPFIGEFIEILTSFFKYHFSITKLDDTSEIGEYRKTRLFYDHYELTVDDAAYSQQDWQVWAALAVALDALQSR